MANNEVAVYVEPHLADPAQLNDWNKMLLLDNSFVTQFSRDIYWSGNSAKVLVPSFSSPLCKSSHGEYSENSVTKEFA